MRAVGGDDLGAVLQALQRGRCVLCVGGELAADGSLRRLIGKLLEALPDPADARVLLENKPLMAADHVRRRYGGGFIDELRRVTTSTEVPEPLALLGTLPFSAVLTTSYDPAVERAFTRAGTPPPVLTPSDGPALRTIGRTRFVFKLLGDLQRPETVVWGASDLQHALAGGGYQPIVDDLFRTRTFLWLGFDWIDAELSLFLERILSAAGRGGQHYALLSRMTPLEREELQTIYGIRVLDGVDATSFTRALHAAINDPHRAMPADDDVDAWLSMLADDPARGETIDALEDRLRRRGDAGKLIELYVGRIAVESDPARRATYLQEAARLYEDDLHDPGHALTALLAAYREAPSRAAWERLERLAAAVDRWKELADELAAQATRLPPADRADGWARLAALYDEELGDLNSALSAATNALALMPEHRGALHTRLSALRRAGRWKDVADALARMVFVEDSLARKSTLYGALGDLFATHLEDPAQALACYRLAVESDGTNAEARAALELGLVQRGEIGELIDHLEARAARAPAAEQPQLRRRIAEICEERLGDLALATRHWEALRMQAPDDLGALRALARLYEQTGRTRDLLAVLADAATRCESERDRADLLRRLAAEWERQPGGLARAADSLEALLALEPSDPAALEALERVYRTDGRQHELAAVLQRHLSVAPPEARVRLLLQLAATQESLGQVDHAHGAYLEVLRLAPDQLEAFDALIRLYEGAGAYDRVVALCEERAARSPAEAQVALLAKAGELAGDQLGDPVRAEALFARALELDAHHVPSLIGLAQLYRRGGELRRAAQLLTEAVERTQNRLLRTRLLVEAGEIHERLDDPDGAIAVYQRALALDPDHVDAAARAGELLWRAGRFAEVLPILEALAGKDAPVPVQVERFSRVGRAAARVNDGERAQKAFRRALAIEPTHLESLRGLGTVLFTAERWTEARPVLTALLDAHEPALPAAEQVELYHRLGVCALKAGHAAEARERFAMACAIDPTHRPSRLLQVELGAQDPAALIEAKKALLPTAAHAEKVRLHVEIGDLYLDRLEDPVQAVGAWQAGLQEQADDVRLLHRCLNVFVEQKAWSQAMSVVDRLLAGESKPIVRAKYHYTAGMICLEHLGRFADAADHLWASIEGDPSYRRAATALEEMLRNHKSWKELARYFQVRLRAMEPIDSAEKRDEQLRLWSELADLYLERLHDTESGVVALEVALKLDPTPKRRQRLATVCTAAGGQWLDRAIAEHQSLLREDKARIASYRALKELYASTNRATQAHACAVALACLLPEEGAPPDDARSAFEKPLPGDVLARLRHPDEDPELNALFAAVAGAVAATRAQRERLPVPRKQLLADNDPRPLARQIRRAATVIGLPLPLVQLAPEQTEAATLICAVDAQRLVPVLSLGAPLLDEKRDPTFDVARHVAQLRPEHFLRYLLPLPRELSHLIDAAIALADEAGGKAPAGELAKTTDALKRQLPTASLSQVVTLGHRFRARGLDPQAAALRWLQASDLGLNRLGYVIAGDLPRCARILKHEPPPPSSLPAAQRILDLLWSSVTDDLTRARP